MNDLVEVEYSPAEAEKCQFKFEIKDLATQQPRSIFVSDIHLGCKYGNSHFFLDFLQRYEPEYLYIVGDFLDGWRLSKRWYWTDCYSEIIHRLNELALGGTKVFYTPGNHDEFLRSFMSATFLFGNIQVANEFTHVTADNRRFLITHGDQFDKVVRGHRRISGFGDQLYNLAMALNRGFNRGWTAIGGRPVHVSKYLKQQVKKVTSAASGFEPALISYALANDCDGIVCGHIHQPTIRIDATGVVYCNTGDWVENASAIIESNDGQLALVHANQIV